MANFFHKSSLNNDDDELCNLLTDILKSQLFLLNQNLEYFNTFLSHMQVKICSLNKITSQKYTRYFIPDKNTQAVHNEFMSKLY